MHAVHKCGLLLQTSHVAWSVCLSVCVCVCVANDNNNNNVRLVDKRQLHGYAVQKLLKWSRCRLGCRLLWIQEPCIRWRIKIVRIHPQPQIIRSRSFPFLYDFHADPSTVSYDSESDAAQNKIWAPSVSKYTINMCHL